MVFVLVMVDVECRGRWSYARLPVRHPIHMPRFKILNRKVQRQRASRRKNFSVGLPGWDVNSPRRHSLYLLPVPVTFISFLLLSESRGIHSTSNVEVDGQRAPTRSPVPVTFRSELQPAQAASKSVLSIAHRCHCLADNQIRDSSILFNSQSDIVEQKQEQ